MKKYNSLNEDQKIMLKFNQWIMYTIQDCSEYKNSRLDFYNMYKSIRFWCVDLITELDLIYDNLPLCNKENESFIYEDCESKIDLDSFKNLKVFIFEIKKKNGKIFPELKGDD